MARVELQAVSKSFPAPGRPANAAARNLSLVVDAGELVALVGPSGCGKTTTLRLIAGLETPDAGTIAFDGRSVNALPPHARDVAMVFQQPALYPHLTARENLALGLKLRKVARDEAVRRIAEVADWLGLGALLDRRPYALSGGERQRVALGRALARRPRVLLLDEPFSSLDAPLRAQLRDDLRRLQRQLRLTTMCVTHDPAEALTLGQRVAVMREGAVQQSAPPAEIYQRPANVFVAGFLGPMNFFPGRLEAYGGTLRFAIQNGPVLTVPPERAASLRPAAGAAALLGLRPEELSLQDGATPGAFSVTVDAVEVTGADTLARARFGNERLLFRVPLHVRLAPGDVARLSPDPDRLRFFDPATGAALG